MGSNTKTRAVRSVIIAIITATCFGPIAAAALPSATSPVAASAPANANGGNPWG